MNPILSAIFGFLGGLAFEVLKEWFHGLFFAPKLLLSFHGDQPGYVLDTELADDRRDEFLGGPTGPRGPHLNESRTKYVRIRIVNTGNRIATNCRAYLTGFRRSPDNRNGPTSGYADSIPLCWSYRKPDDPQGIDIPRGPHIHCDVFSTTEGSRSMNPCLVRMPTYCENLFTEVGRYTLEIVITANEIEPQRISLVVDWR